MNIEEAVAAATEGAAALLSCLGQPVVAYRLTTIMREVDAIHAREMREEFVRSTVDALVADGLEGTAAESLASVLDGRVGSAWKLLRSADGTSH